MGEFITYAAQVAIPVWCVVSVLVVIKLIKDNAELGSRLTDAISSLEKSTTICSELSSTSKDLIATDRKEITIFEQKEAEIEAIREKYEYRIQEVSEYLDSFAERLVKCCNLVSENDKKVYMLDRDVESCSKAIVLLKNEIEDMKKKGVTVWDVTTSDWDPPVMACNDEK